MKIRIINGHTANLCTYCYQHSHVTPFDCCFLTTEPNMTHCFFIQMSNEAHEAHNHDASLKLSAILGAVDRCVISAYRDKAKHFFNKTHLYEC
jgi:hypothetical protein